MITNWINNKAPLIRQNIVFGIFLALIFITSFFSGDWNNWLQSFILILTSLLLGYIIFLYYKKDTNSLDRIKDKIGNPNYYLIGFLIIVLVSSFFSINRYNSFSQFFLLLSFVVIYFSAYHYKFGWKKIKIINKTIFYTGAFTSLIALIMFTFQNDDRVSGLLFNANALGGYLIFSFLIGLVLLFTEYASKKTKILDIICWLIISAALLLSYSYTAWFALIISVVFILIYFRKKIFTKKSIKWWLFLILILFLSLSFLRYQNSNNLSEAIKIYENISTEHFNFSFEQRLNHNLAAWDIFKDNMWIGSGYTTFQSAIGQYAYSVSEQPRYTHNYFMQTLAEVGIFGLIFLLGFITTILFRARKLFKEEPDQEKKKILLIIYVGLIATSINSLVDFSWQFPAVFVVFWIFSGIINKQYQNSTITEGNDEVEDKRNFVVQATKILGLLIIIILLIRGGTLLLGNYYNQNAEIAQINGELQIEEENLLLSYKFDPDPNKLVDYVQARIKFPILLTDEDYIDLEDKMQSLININEEEYFAHWMLGKLYVLQSKNDLAITEFEKAIKYNPLFRPDFYYNLALVYYDQGDYLKSKQVIYSILEKYPVDISSTNLNLPTQLSYLYVLLGRNYFEEGDYVQARENYEKALSYVPDFNIALNQLEQLKEQ